MLIDIDDNNDGVVVFRRGEGLERIPSTEECDEVVGDESGSISSQEEKLTGVKLFTVIVSLILAVFMASANENMVATAIGSITTSLHASGDVTWVIASYLLLATASQPLYGKFSDIFGRRPCLIFATLIFLIGSTGCGASNSIPTLAFFRSLDGIGAGGLTSLGYIVIGDLIPLDRRGSFMSLLQLTFAVSGILGPIVGGLLVDLSSWRMVFYITIPMGLILLIAVWWVPGQPPDTLRNKLVRIDFGGAFSLVLGTILVILGCNWGGKEFSWSSWQVILCFMLGSIFLIVFILIEIKVSEPLVPFRIFNKNTTCLTLINVSIGFVLFNFTTHLPLYFQHVQYKSATITGFLTIPVYIGVSLTAALSGFLVDRIQKPIPLMRLGMMLVVLGCLLCLLIRDGISLFEEILFSSLVGIGIGLNLQLAIILAQASNTQEDMAVSTALMRYSLAFGGTLGLAIHGAIFNNVLASYLLQLLPTHPELGPILASPSNILNALTTLKDQTMVHTVLLSSYRILFLSLLPAAIVGLIASITLRNINSNNDRQA